MIIPYSYLEDNTLSALEVKLLFLFYSNKAISQPIFWTDLDLADLCCCNIDEIATTIKLLQQKGYIDVRITTYNERIIDLLK